MSLSFSKRNPRERKNKLFFSKENLKEKKNKRGQVTVFIFIGVFLLIIIGVFFYFRNELIIDRFGGESRIGVSEQFRPVRDYYEECVRGVAIEGIDFVGSQGGYLNIDEDFTAQDAVNGFKSYLDISGNNIAQVPYWYYQQNNNIDVVKIPSLADVEENIAKYIDANAGRCFDNSTLLSAYNVKDYGGVNAAVDVEEDKVFVAIKTPIDVEFNDVTETIPEISIIAEIPLGRMYNTARRISDAENKGYFLEERTIDYMGLYDEIPLTGAGFECNTKIWDKRNVINDFKKILSYNLLQLTTNDKGGVRYNNIGVNGDGLNIAFSYQDNWPFYLDVQPSDNGVLRSDQIVKNAGITRAIAGFFCLQSYHFVYDVKYPVLVSVESNGHVFQFATQVVILNNAARKIPYDIGFEEETLDVCKNDNGFLNINLYKVNNNDELESTDAGLSLKCLNQICELGNTFNGEYMGEVPACGNAVVRADKNGYYSNGGVVSTNVYESNSIILEPVYNRGLEVKLIDKNGIRDVDEEYANLEFVHEDGYSEGVVYPEDKQIELIAGEYKVKGGVFVKSKDGFEVGGGEIETCVDVPRAGFSGLFLSKKECVNAAVGESKVYDVLIGGGEFELDVGRKEIVAGKKLVVYFIVDDVPRSYEEIQRINDKLPYNSEDARFILPIWSLS